MHMPVSGIRHVHLVRSLTHCSTLTYGIEWMYPFALGFRFANLKPFKKFIANRKVHFLCIQV